MKKLITLLLVLAMALTMAACAADTNPGEDKNTESTGADNVEVNPDAGNDENSLTILENIWEKDTEKFSVSGGNMEYHIEQMEKDENYIPPNGPGFYQMEYAENLPYVLYIPEDQMANVDEAATMIHAMLANNFSSGVVHVKEGTDVNAMANAIKDNLAQTQWICGTPDQMLVAVVGGEYVLIAFGINDAMDPFVTALGEAYPDAEVIYSGSIIG